MTDERRAEFRRRTPSADQAMTAAVWALLLALSGGPVPPSKDLPEDR